MLFLIWGTLYIWRLSTIFLEEFIYRANFYVDVTFDPDFKKYDLSRMRVITYDAPTISLNNSIYMIRLGLLGVFSLN